MTAQEEMPTAPELTELTELTALRDTALALLSEAPVPPSSIRVRSGELEVAIEWTAAVPGAAPPGTAAPGTAAPRTAPAAPEPAAAADGAAGAPAAAAGVRHLTAGLVGTFYRSPSPGAPCFVEAGDRVAPGQQVGIVEAMKLMTPVEADCSGRVLEVFTADGTAVEYGAPLMAIACD